MICLWKSEFVQAGGEIMTVVENRKCKEIEHKQFSWENGRETMKAPDITWKLQS